MQARWLLTFALGAAIVSPLARARSWDSFPISSFPMFSRGDLGTRVSVGQALAVDAQGNRRPVPPALVGTPEVMVAKNVIERAISEGRAADLCARIAERARAELGVSVTHIEIATSELDTKTYFEDPSPLRRDVHASCSVSR